MRAVVSHLHSRDASMLSRTCRELTHLRPEKEEFRVANFYQSVSLLTWAAQNGCALEGRLRAITASLGDVEAMVCLESMGCEFDETTTAAAALGGNLDTLRWLREKPNPCAWDETTTDNAAGGGHVELLSWAYDRGCPVSDDTCELAVGSGQLNMLRWLLTHEDEDLCGCPSNDCLFTVAMQHGHAHVMDWLLREVGVTPDEGHAQYAVEIGRVEMVEWFVTRGIFSVSYFSDPEVLEDVVERGHVPILRWIVRESARRRRAVILHPELRAIARRSERHYMLRWLEQNGCVESA